MDMTAAVRDELDEIIRAVASGGEAHAARSAEAAAAAGGGGAGAVAAGTVMAEDSWGSVCSPRLRLRVLLCVGLQVRPSLAGQPFRALPLA